MKKQLLLALALLFFVALSAQEVGIEFENGSFTEALAKAKAEGKYLFIDCYTSWCVPCKELEKEVFTDPEVAEYFNSRFINFRIDVEKGEGIELKKRYGVQPVPTLLFVNSEGKIEHKFVGTSTPADFIKRSEEVFTNENRYGVLEKKYNAGVRELDFMEVYLKELLSLGEYEKTKALMSSMIEETSPEQLCNTSFWPLLTHNFIAEFESAFYHFLLDNRKTLIRNVGQEEFNNKMASIFKRYSAIWIFSGAQKGDESENIKIAMQDVRKLSLDENRDVPLLLEIAEVRVRNNYEQFVNLIEKNFGVLRDEDKFMIFIDSDFFSKEATPELCRRYLKIIQKFNTETENENYRNRLGRIITNLENVISKTNQL